MTGMTKMIRDDWDDYGWQGMTRDEWDNYG